MPGAANQVRVTVQGRTHEDVEEVRAYLTKDDANGKNSEQIVGRLNVIAYDQEIRNLVLAPVNNPYWRKRHACAISFFDLDSSLL